MITMTTILWVLAFVVLFFSGIALLVYLELRNDRKRKVKEAKEYYDTHKEFGIFFDIRNGEVVHADSRKLIFKTDGIYSKLIYNVVIIWNEGRSCAKCLFSDGTVDKYLLNEAECTQYEREYIVEALYNYACNN